MQYFFSATFVAIAQGFFTFPLTALATFLCSLVYVLRFFLGTHFGIGVIYSSLPNYRLLPELVVVVYNVYHIHL